MLNYSTKHPKVELRLGTGQYFTGYNADSDEPYYLKGASMDGNSYQIGMWVDTDAKPGYYLSSPNRYTQEELAALDESLWKEYKIAEATPGSIVLPFILITIDAAAYEENGGWYVYAKATNPTGTTFVSTPNIIIDVENPKAIDLSTGKELENYGKYYGNLRFKVEDSSPVTVRCHTSPSGKAELLTPDENGVYTIPAEYDNSIQHTLIIEDACGNVASYRSFKVFWNYLTNVREKDHWDVAPAQPIRISREQNLKEELSKVQIGVFAADTSGFIPVEVSWEIPADYDPQSQREQTFTVNGTVILEGTGARCNSGLDVITRPGEEWKKNISVQVTVEGEPQYKVTVQDCKNGRVKVVNAAGTAEDGTPLFCKDELVMLSIAPDEGYMLSTLSVNGIPATVAAGEDTYTFVQPEGDVTITAAFEKRNEHTVTFDANGGSEPEDLPEEVTTAMPAKKVLHGSEYYLPECEFVAPEGKQFKAWEIGGAEYPVNAPVTVTADITVKALWEDAPPAPTEYIVTVTNDGNGIGTATPSTAAAGTEITLTATPDTGYHFKTWQVESPTGLVITNNKFTMPDGNVAIKAIFEEDAPPAPAEFIVTFDGNGGMPSVGSMTTTDQKLTSLPSASRSGSYSFYGWYTEKSGGTKVTTDTEFHANTTVYAHWTYTGGYTPPVRPRPAEDVSAKYPGFVDAPASSYFYEAVMWAVESGVTTGVSANRFDPNGVCTRAQAVTFLWRAAGSPAPRSRTMPFTDVPVGSYYYDAVLWAVENGITKGTSETRFSPDATCTRAQIVAFLWRSEKSPAAGSRNPFADVKSSAYYADAVLWAVKEDITKGTTNTTFSPDADCTRAQIVTFLWRCKK